MIRDQFFSIVQLTGEWWKRTVRYHSLTWSESTGNGPNRTETLTFCMNKDAGNDLLFIYSFGKGAVIFRKHVLFISKLHFIRLNQSHLNIESKIQLCLISKISWPDGIHIRSLISFLQWMPCFIRMNIRGPTCHLSTRPNRWVGIDCVSGCMLIGNNAQCFRIYQVLLVLIWSSSVAQWSITKEFIKIWICCLQLS